MLSTLLFSLLLLPVNMTNSTFHSNKSVNDYTDLAHSIRFSMYYSEGDFMSKLNIKSCTIMSLNCQSLHGKFIQAYILVDTLNSKVVTCLQSNKLNLDVSTNIQSLSLNSKF